MYLSAWWDNITTAEGDYFPKRVFTYNMVCLRTTHVRVTHYVCACDGCFFVRAGISLGVGGRLSVLALPFLVSNGGTQ